MSDITWTYEKRKIGDLIGWPENPRYSKKKTAINLVVSKEKFGQPIPLVIGPNNELYDGHQRLPAWGKKYGYELEVNVVVSSRPLNDEEREAFVLLFHAGTVGAWNPNILANYDPARLIEYGFDHDMREALQEQLSFNITLLNLGDTERIFNADDIESYFQGEDAEKEIDDKVVFTINCPSNKAAKFKLLLDSFPGIKWAVR